MGNATEAIKVHQAPGVRNDSLKWPLRVKRYRAIRCLVRINVCCSRESDQIADSSRERRNGPVANIPVNSISYRQAIATVGSE
jgi:hypothetical protein